MAQTLKGNGIVAIRRENKSKWEKRAALSPKEVKYLVENGIKVLVQPSDLRCYENFEYEKEGAIIQEDISEAGTILGVKEVPIDNLLPDRTYLFFSHTIKGQQYNMRMLQQILERNIRLIDYEKIENAQGQRLVAFGRYAGIVGMYDFLQGIGYYFLNKKISSPFMCSGLAFMTENYKGIQSNLAELSILIKQKGLPKKYLPFIVCFTSNGRCSQGAQEVFKQLPHRMLEPEELVNFNPDPVEMRTTLYGVVIESQHMYAHKDENQEFNKTDFYKNPQNYKSIFSQKFLPKLSIIVHCAYWEAKFPQLVTDNDLQSLWVSGNCRLIGICDITCDKQGGIEACKIFTDPYSPF